MSDLFDHIDLFRRTGQAAALATVVDVEGGSSSRIGARMIVTPEGRRLGSLTVGGCVDNRAAEDAALVIEDGEARSILVRLGDDEPDFGMSCAGVVRVFLERVDADGPQLKAFDRVRACTKEERRVVAVTPLDGRSDRFVVTAGKSDVPWDIERALGRMGEEDAVLLPAREDRPELFLQSFTPPPLLVVVGTGPVAEPLIRMADQLGYRTCIVDGRPIEGYPEADDRLTGIPSDICRDLDLNERSAVVIAAHDYKYEVPVLREVVGRSVGFVGFVASSRRGGAVLKFLETTGVDPALMAEVRVPVGLDVGAATPAEIAVSILAEMLAVRTGRHGGSMRLERELERSGSERGERRAGGIKAMSEQQQAAT